MRPIDRGPAPREYSRYEDAKEDLVARLGLYCSYCERPILTMLAVEHVQPKALYTELEVTWENFVLGCTNCNSTKGDRDVVRARFILPDQDNSFRAFVYTEEGAIVPNERLAADVQGFAAATLWLTGLDKFPTDFEGEEFEAALERWQQRSLAWTKAKRMRERLRGAEYGDSDLRATIAEAAAETGFFSVWMLVFEDDSDMKRRLIANFRGTALDCFAPNGNPLSRPGGHC